MRRVLVVALALLAAACHERRERPGTAPRSVVLVTIAALRADHVSAYLYHRPTTAGGGEGGQGLPIDRVVEEGVAFARAFAPSGRDLPSLLALHRAGGGTLAERLAEEGLRTAAFTAGEAAVRGSGLERGFDVFANPGEEEGAADPDYAAVRAATAWLREALAEEGPVFVWLHLDGPAAPYEPAPLGAETFADRFDDPDHAPAVDGSAEALATLAAPGASPDPLDLAHVVALYDAEIARANHLVASFLQACTGRYGVLPRDLLAESALVVAGSRGASLYQHARRFEAPDLLADATLHVPLALRHRGSLTGRRVLADVVELADVAPTVLHWLGLEEPAGGRSLLDLADGRAFEERAATAVAPDGARSVRTERWRLVLGPEGAPRLFDHAEDPLELEDVAARHPAVVARLAALLDAEPAVPAADAQ